MHPCLLFADAIQFPAAPSHGAAFYFQIQICIKICPKIPYWHICCFTKIKKIVFFVKFIWRVQKNVLPLQPKIKLHTKYTYKIINELLTFLNHGRRN